MKLDLLSEKTGDIVQDRDRLREEFELFYSEMEKVRAVKEQAGDLDGIIQDAIWELGGVFDNEEDLLRVQENEVESRKDGLSRCIQEELSKLQETLGVLDAVSGKKYAGGIEKASETCKEYITQLEVMLNQLGDDPPEKPGTFSILGNGSSSGKTGSGDVNRSSLMNRYPLINGAHSIEDDLAATNPNYSTNDPDSPWNVNCQRCVSAYEARRRGYDVVARPVPEDRKNDVLPIMMHPQGWPSVYMGAKLVDCSANSGTAAMENVKTQLASWGDNARAIVRVRWKLESGGGGHVFIAERNNGVTRFVDPQNGSTDVSGYFDFANGSDLFCMRIDNLDFTDRIHQCCQIKRNS